MEFRSITEKNFHARGETEGADTFIEKHLPSAFREIVFAIADKHKMSIEAATAYVLSYFNAVDDLIMFHVPFKTKRFEIKVSSGGDGFGKRTIKGFAKKLAEPYFRNRLFVSNKLFKTLDNYRKRELSLTKEQLLEKEIPKEEKERLRLEKHRGYYKPGQPKRKYSKKPTKEEKEEFKKKQKKRMKRKRAASEYWFQKHGLPNFKTGVF